MTKRVQTAQLEEMVKNTQEILTAHYTRFIEKGRMGRGYTLEDSVRIEFEQLRGMYGQHSKTRQGFLTAIDTMRYTARDCEFPDEMLDVWNEVLDRFEYQMIQAHQALMAAIVAFMEKHPFLTE